MSRLQELRAKVQRAERAAEGKPAKGKTHATLQRLRDDLEREERRALSSWAGKTRSSTRDRR